MIEDLKRIKIEEIDKEIANLEKTMPVKKQYNWLERTITKKKEFTRSIDDYYIKKEEIEQKRQELESKKEKYLEAKVPAELDLTFENAIKLLKDKEIDPVLTEADLTDSYVFTKPNVDNLDGLILVHKSGHVPTDSRIHSTKEAKIKKTLKYTIGEKEVETNYNMSRNTVHFSVNGEVHSHENGNWDDKKYAVLIPFKDIPKQDILSAAPEDTYILGGVNLTPNSWILVPKGEREEVQKNNPQVNILEYEGRSVSGYANQLIKNLGYNCKSISKNGWINTNRHEKKDRYGHVLDGSTLGNSFESEETMYTKLIAKEGLIFLKHYDTRYHYQENLEMWLDLLQSELYYAYENMELLKDKKIRNDLLNKIKLNCDHAIRPVGWQPDKSTLIQMICEKFKNTPFEVDTKSFAECQNFDDIIKKLSDILINKLLVEEKGINTEEQKTSIKR